MFCFIPIGSLRADEKIASVQQTLKEQGFYYGEVTGRKDADTTAAIRRFQIRNGLKITGNLDAETERSLRLGATGSARATPALPPSRPDVTSDLRDDSFDEEDPRTPSYPPNYGSYRAPDPRVYPPGPRGMQPEIGGIFDNTPYEFAPSGLQRRVIADAQMVLARHGYYRSDIDGIYGPGTEFALRAFQSQVRLPLDGRLNMETLSALGLLPRQHAQRPVRRMPRRQVYRGEWIPW
jgi:peptidoglycan hydrolase-like protein with peptidoglycan-binding domain